jgi:hypothetical protein
MQPQERGHCIEGQAAFGCVKQPGVGGARVPPWFCIDIIPRGKLSRKRDRYNGEYSTNHIKKQ